MSPPPSAKTPDMMEQLLGKLRDDFIQELPGRVDEIENQLLMLEESGLESDLFQQLFRTVHSLKGSGGTFGFAIVTTICHRLEDLLTQATQHTQHPDKEVIALGLGFVDLLRSVIDGLQAGNRDFQSVSQRLEATPGLIKHSPLRCLVVEGSKMTRQLYAHVLQQSGVEVIICDNGYQALGRLLQERFDVLVTGMEVGELTGLALLSALRTARSPNPDIVTIFIPANSVRLEGQDCAHLSYTLYKGETLSRDISNVIEEVKAQRR